MAKHPKMRLVTNAELEYMGVRSEDLSGEQLMKLMEGQPIEWPCDPNLPLPPKQPLADRIKDGLSSAVLSSISGLLRISLLTVTIILLSQAYLYLKNGAWPHWVLFTAIEGSLPANFRHWLLDPQDWLGFHKIAFYILMEIPITLAIFLFVVLLIVVLVMPIALIN